jgi:hypothetical protein
MAFAFVIATVPMTASTALAPAENTYSCLTFFKTLILLRFPSPTPYKEGLAEPATLSKVVFVYHKKD